MNHINITHCHHKTIKTNTVEFKTKGSKKETSRQVGSHTSLINVWSQDQVDQTTEYWSVVSTSSE